jgi:hypothetical protein
MGGRSPLVQGRSGTSLRCPPGRARLLLAPACAPHALPSALTAWEPLIVHGGRELPTGVSQTVTDALTYGGRFRTFPVR